MWAKQTILCTGGAGQLYRETTNPDVATGDGHALAYRAGAELRDMEFMQFHPTVLYIAGSSRNLITEAMRGEGAQLVDRDGHRFMPDYDRAGRAGAARRRQPGDRHADGKDAAPERLSRPVASRRRHGCARGFPGIAAVCAEFGIDITRDRIPVRPGAHYMIGGVTVDHAGPHDGARPVGGRRSHVAAGCTARIGWRRTACWKGWSTARTPARGRRARRGRSPTIFGPCRWRTPPARTWREPLDLADIRNSLKSLMWRNVGVRRDRAGLAEAAETIDRWCGYVLDRQFADPAGWELQNMLCVARLMVRAAARARGEPRASTCGSISRRPTTSTGGGTFPSAAE